MRVLPSSIMISGLPWFYQGTIVGGGRLLIKHIRNAIGYILLPNEEHPAEKPSLRIYYDAWIATLMDTLRTRQHFVAWSSAYSYLGFSSYRIGRWFKGKKKDDIVVGFMITCVVLFVPF